MKTVKFPSLVKKQFCKTPVEVTIYGEGITEDGSPVIAFECKNLYPSENLYPSATLHGGSALCNMQSKGKDSLYQRAENCSGVGCLAF